MEIESLQPIWENLQRELILLQKMNEYILKVICEVLLQFKYKIWQFKVKGTY